MGGACCGHRQVPVGSIKMDHRSLEDKILKKDLLREPDSDDDRGKDDPDDVSEPEPDPFAEGAWAQCVSVGWC